MAGVGVLDDLGNVERKPLLSILRYHDIVGTVDIVEWTAVAGGVTLAVRPSRFPGATRRASFAGEEADKARDVRGAGVDYRVGELVRRDKAAVEVAIDLERGLDVGV